MKVSQNLDQILYFSTIVIWLNFVTSTCVLSLLNYFDIFITHEMHEETLQILSNERVASWLCHTKNSEGNTRGADIITHFLQIRMENFKIVSAGCLFRHNLCSNLQPLHYKTASMPHAWFHFLFAEPARWKHVWLYKYQ